MCSHCPKVDTLSKKLGAIATAALAGSHRAQISSHSPECQQARVCLAPVSVSTAIRLSVAAAAAATAAAAAAAVTNTVATAAAAAGRCHTWCQSINFCVP